ncbi:hypothetical protein L798_01276 [Zootermopsis nevadensis]|uniref:Uncharacterized protein n=1 Tax=Zootermopsis nevadensis TaxID=136037 RepID=A0A067QLZ5_ZOONE|nr:hypothetical protein L798_01276 [Zootermopsis nevadensis]
MSMAPALAALQVGLDAPRIKLALRHKMEQTGMPFTTSDALIAAVLDIQMNEETVSAASSNSSSNSSVNIASRESEGEDDQQSSPLKVSRSMPMLSDQREEKPDRTKLLTDQSNTKSMPHLLSAGNDSSKAKGE